MGSAPSLDLGPGQSTRRIYRQSLCDKGRSRGVIRGVCVVLLTAWRGSALQKSSSASRDHFTIVVA